MSGTSRSPVIFLILLVVFIGITASIVTALPLVIFDKSFAHFLFTLRTPFLAQAFYLITNFADQITIAILGIAALLYLYFKKELAYIYALIGIFLGTEASVYILKILINRPRPLADIAYYVEKDPSFPSGHSAIATAFFGFITYYLIRHSEGRNKKGIVLLLGTLLILVVGFSRLYLGVHYMSDVLGGFLMGGLWLVAGITCYERYLSTTLLKKGEK